MIATAILETASDLMEAGLPKRIALVEAFDHHTTGRSESFRRALFAILFHCAA